MIAKNPDLPVVMMGSSYQNGPELKDPRMNLEYSLFVRNKVDGEKFWVKYISGES